MNSQRRDRELATVKSFQVFVQEVITSLDPSECWSWSGECKARNTYGTFKSLAVHRLSQLAFNGEIPIEAPNVLHSCDNKWCWNPNHLSPGTARRNVQERHERTPEKTIHSSFYRRGIRDIFYE